MIYIIFLMLFYATCVYIYVIINGKISNIITLYLCVIFLSFSIFMSFHNHSQYVLTWYTDIKHQLIHTVCKCFIWPTHFHSFKIYIFHFRNFLHFVNILLLQHSLLVCLYERNSLYYNFITTYKCCFFQL